MLTLRLPSKLSSVPRADGSYNVSALFFLSHPRRQPPQRGALCRARLASPCSARGISSEQRGLQDAAQVFKGSNLASKTSKKDNTSGDRAEKPRSS